MIVQIDLNEVERSASICVYKNDKPVNDFLELPDEEQVLLINSMLRFSEVFFNAYAKEHPEIATDLSEKESGE